MMVYAVVTHPKYFSEIVSGRKTFIVAKDVLECSVGDFVAINEYNEENGIFTGNSVIVYIDYIQRGDEWVKDGFAIMSIKPCSVIKHTDPLDSCRMKLDYGVPYATRKGEEL